MSIMRHNRFIIIAILAFIGQIPTYLFAQDSIINEYKNELSEYILELDEIEGLYDVSFKIEVYAPIVGWDTQTEKYTAVIYANPDEEGEFFVIALEDDSDFPLGTIKKGGGNGHYTFDRRMPKGGTYASQMQLNDMFYFEINEEHVGGVARSFVEWKFVKFYPTEKMYSEAFHKQEEEHNMPKQWTGSGFAIQEGYVVTNYHVIDKAKEITIYGTKDIFSESVEAQIVATDKDNDLAILKIKGNVSEISLPYSIKTFTSDVGEEIWVLGYPLTSTMGDEIKLTTGVISSRSGYEGSVSMYQISAPAHPGNSGGPVFDKDGNLIGIVCSKHTKAENATYAIKSSCLRNLVESSINHDILPHTNTMSGKDLPEKVKDVKKYVYYINCTR